MLCACLLTRLWATQFSSELKFKWVAWYILRKYLQSPEFSLLGRPWGEVPDLSSPYRFLMNSTHHGAAYSTRQSDVHFCWANVEDFSGCAPRVLRAWVGTSLASTSGPPWSTH
jgi:hypothetical protein